MTKPLPNNPLKPQLKPLIVVVDDEPMMTSSLSAMLSLDNSAEVTCFNSPVLALETLRAQGREPEVLVSDYLMPEMTGLEFLKALRPACPETTFILLTGYADKENAIEAINEVGIYKYLEKPWNNDDLRLTIRNAVERYRLRRQLKARVDELEVAHAALEKMNHELDARVQARTAELSQALESLKEIDRMREDFIATLTHDMRTPLLAAIQTLKLMLEGSVDALTPRQLEITGMLLSSQEDLLNLVNTLLDIYRYEAHQQTLILEETDLAQLSQEVVQGLKPLADERRQSLSVIVPELPAGAWQRVDKFAIKRVMMNLVSNAIRYTPHEGCIRVTLAAHEHGGLLWSVEDNGRGIPAPDLAKLFQRFAQGTSTHRTTGSGLGLYLSKQIIEAHGGTIGVESVEGQGSRFYVVL